VCVRDPLLPKIQCKEPDNKGIQLAANPQVKLEVKLIQDTIPVQYQHRQHSLGDRAILQGREVPGRGRHEHAIVRGGQEKITSQG